MYLTQINRNSYPQDIQCIIQPVHGKGGIYISNYQAAKNIRTLKRYNIGAVLTAAKGLYLSHNKIDIPFYLYVPGKDHQKFDLSVYFQQAATFIQNSLNYTNLLVHCVAGVSRSVTLLLAYLIKIKGYPFEEAYILVKKRRKIIHPNNGFIKQLRVFESQLKSNKQIYRAYSPSLRLGSYQNIVSKDSIPENQQQNQNGVLGYAKYIKRQRIQTLQRVTSSKKQKEKLVSNLVKIDTKKSIDEQIHRYKIAKIMKKYIENKQYLSLKKYKSLQRIHQQHNNNNYLVKSPKKFTNIEENYMLNSFEKNKLNPEQL